MVVSIIATSFRRPGITRTSDSPYAWRRAADDVSVNAAGGYAQQRYQRGLASWRRRAVRPLVLACSPVVVLAILLAAATGSGPLWFAAGLALGGVGAIVSVARHDPPSDVANWGLGAQGERRTGEVLRALETEGWQVQHDLELRRGGNLDHLVVGPHGVFLLETKATRGRADVEDGTLTAYSSDDDETVWRHRGLRGRLLANAAALSREIAGSANVRTWVQPVVVIWDEFPRRVVEDRGLAYVHGDDLLVWLRERRPVPRELELDS
jgi:hypothetical protein